MNNLKDLLPNDHVVYTMIVEHDKILEFLNELDELNHDIQKMSIYNKEAVEFTQLLKLANNLLDAENHHQREEQVLFIELENKGILGPTQVMRHEHEDLRAKKKKLRELGEQVSNLDFNQFKQVLNELVHYIVVTLANHIYKENNVLYPASIRAIQDDEKWDDMKGRCDKIGYCGFTAEIS